jgi:serralysin
MGLRSIVFAGSVVAAAATAAAARAEGVRPGPGSPVTEAAQTWMAEAHTPTYVCKRDFWVDAEHGQRAYSYPDGGGDKAHPWLTLQDVESAKTADGKPTLRGGDCVNFLPGRYEMEYGVQLTHGGERNAPDGWLVLRSATPRAAHLVAVKPRDPAVKPLNTLLAVYTAYVIVDGLDFDGGDATATGEAVATYESAGHHHIVVENSLIHGVGGSGVQLNDSEFFWVVGNEVWGNASTNPYQGSGISTYQAQAATNVAPSPDDEALKFHIVIVGNTSHDNRTTYLCTPKPGCHTDGNGIIIDKTRNVDRKGGVPYAGRVLVAGNYVFGNGGGGVHLYLSEHVIVAGNVAIGDQLDTQNPGSWRGELSNADSHSTAWIGNLGWAKPGPGVLAHNSGVLVAVSNGVPAGRGVAWMSNTTCGGDASVYQSTPALDPSKNQWNADPKACSRMAAEATGDDKDRLDPAQ